MRAADPSAPTARGPKAADAAGKDPFAVPDLKPPELLKWIQKGEKYQPQLSSQEELVDFMKKSRRALVAAADKILEAKTSDSTRLAAIRSKRAALGILDQAHDPDAAKMLKEFLDQIKDEKQPEVVRMVKTVGLKVRMNEIGGDPAAFAKVWDELKSELNAAPADRELLSIAVGFADGIEQRDPRRAPQVLTELADILSKSKDSKVTEVAGSRCWASRSRSRGPCSTASHSTKARFKGKLCCSISGPRGAGLARRSFPTSNRTTRNITTKVLK
jgi:hypothetical protein